MQKWAITWLLNEPKALKQMKQHWFGGRSRRMVVEGYYSDWKPENSGVLNGLVLGPMLFVIFINNFVYNIDGMICKFADDTIISR